MTPLQGPLALISEADVLRSMLKDAGVPQGRKTWHEYKLAKAVLRDFLSWPREMTYKEGIEVLKEWVGV